MMRLQPAHALRGQVDSRPCSCLMNSLMYALPAIDVFCNGEAIKNAIRQGLISTITKEMLEEVEARIQSLEAQIQAPPPSGALVASALPQAIQTAPRA